VGSNFAVARKPPSSLLQSEALGESRSGHSAAECGAEQAPSFVLPDAIEHGSAPIVLSNYRTLSEVGHVQLVPFLLLVQLLFGNQLH